AILIVSSVNGIVGLEETVGGVRKYVVYPLGFTLDHVGPMTRTGKDTAGLLGVIAGFDANDPTSINTPVDDYLGKTTGNVKGLVIGVEENYFFNRVDSEIEALVRAGIKKLEEQ